MAALNKKYVSYQGWNVWRKALKPKFTSAYWAQLGLMRHDVMFDRSQEMREALKRLPKPILDQRHARLTRAHYLDSRKIILPEEEWMKPEDDVPYLEKYLEEVRKEIKEKAEWDNLVLTWKKKRRF